MITVEDTLPPTIDELSYLGPICLWPPNHDYAVLDLERDVDAVIHDTCDPAPYLRFTAASSNQPDDAEGDGATTGDSVLFNDHVCLRAERQGNNAEPRRYLVGLHAFDRFGNASDPVIDVEVRHDQGSGSTCTDTAAEGADDGDARCAAQDGGGSADADDMHPPKSALPVGVGSPGNEPSSAAKPSANPSCAAAGAASPLLLVGAMLLVRRRRSSGLVLAVLLSVALAAGCEATAPSPSSLEDCMVGVWQSRLPLDCNYDCDRDPSLPECGDDCEVRDFLWLKRDGVAVEGYYRASRARQVFSSTGFDVRSWSLDGDRAAIGMREPLPIRCDEQQITIGSTELRVRAQAGTEPALEAAFDESGWVGAPYPN